MPVYSDSARAPDPRTFWWFGEWKHGPPIKPPQRARGVWRASDGLLTDRYRVLCKSRRHMSG